MRRTPAAAAAIVSVAAVAAVAAIGVWLAARSLQQDFAAYWIAGSARRLGLDPYVNQVGSAAAPTLWDGVSIFRHSRFLYPPLVAELFRPLAGLPYRVAKTIFTAGMVLAWIGAGMLVRGRRERTWFFLAGALYFPLYRHLERGQIDLLILLLLLLAWRTRARAPIAGAALALGAAFKPGLLGLLPVLWAVGRGRVALAALGAGLALVGLTIAVSGPNRLREYLVSVLPRVALYGEGGTGDMLLAPDRFPVDDAAGDEGTTRLDGRRYRTAIWNVPAAASVPRLLAPESPTIATNAFPFALTVLGLGWAARQLRGRSTAEPGGRREAGPEALLLTATALACVVTSPTGWVMGVVVAIPIAPLATELWAAGRLPRRVALTLAGAFTALALPAPFGGFPALAGVALLAAATAAALSTRPRAAPSVTG